MKGAEEALRKNDGSARAAPPPRLRNDLGQTVQRGIERRLLGAHSLHRRVLSLKQLLDGQIRAVEPMLETNPAALTPEQLQQPGWCADAKGNHRPTGSISQNSHRRATLSGRRYEIRSVNSTNRRWIHRSTPYRKRRVPEASEAGGEQGEGRTWQCQQSVLRIVKAVSGGRARLLRRGEDSENALERGLDQLQSTCLPN